MMVSFKRLLSLYSKKADHPLQDDKETLDDSRFGLKVLVDKSSEILDAIDIVAIHGLNGDYSRTWTAITSAGTEVNWLKHEDFLPNHLENARIMSYGYNSGFQFSNSQAGISEFADQLLEDLISWRVSQLEQLRPIIFICHSLGGLVFKQAVIRAHEQDRYTALLSHIKGVAFFGTPHRGSDLADWAKMFGNIISIASFGTRTNKRLIKELQGTSEVLSNISRSFVCRGNKDDLKIFSYYETERMPNLNCKVVDNDSAILGWKNEISSPLNGNHRSICRFTAENDQDFRKIWTNLKSIQVTNLSKPHVMTSQEEVYLSSLYRTVKTNDGLTLGYETHKKVNDLCTEGTCRWILKHSRYLDWYNGKLSKPLWFSAHAGCGKSVLASFLIDHISSNKPRDHICYFFFKTGIDAQQSAITALSAFLHQIYSKSPALIKHAIKLGERKGLESFNNFDSIWEVFVCTITDVHAPNTFCFLDGLDECEESSRKLLAGAMKKFFRRDETILSRSPFLKMFVTSRPDNYIKSVFRYVPDVHLKGEDESDNISDDIELVVNGYINELQAFRHATPILANLKIQQTLIQKADRTFLWTDLIVKALMEAFINGASENDLRTILTSRNLDETYDLLLRGRNNPEATRRMLNIVVASARPLSLEEMSVAMCLVPRQDLYATSIKLHYNEIDGHWQRISSSGSIYRSLDAWNSEIKHPFDNFVYATCGHFLRIIKGKIYLVHQTAREFLQGGSSINYLNDDGGTELLLEDSKASKQTTHVHDWSQLSWDIEVSKQTTHVQDLSQHSWKGSVMLRKAHCLMLEICATHVWLFGLPEELDVCREYGAKYNEYCKTDLVRSFLKYSAQYWPLHCRYVRAIYPHFAKKLCNPQFPAFPLWTSYHESFRANFPGRMYIGNSTEDDTDVVLTFFHLQRLAPTTVLELFTDSDDESSATHTEADETISPVRECKSTKGTKKKKTIMSHREKHETRRALLGRHKSSVIDPAFSNPESIREMANFPMERLYTNVPKTKETPKKIRNFAESY